MKNYPENSEDSFLPFQVFSPLVSKKLLTNQNGSLLLMKKSALEKNGTWEITKLLRGKNPVGYKWILQLNKMQMGEWIGSKLDSLENGSLSHMKLIIKRLFLL